MRVTDEKSLILEFGDDGYCIEGIATDVKEIVIKLNGSFGWLPNDTHYRFQESLLFSV